MAEVKKNQANLKILGVRRVTRSKFKSEDPTTEYIVVWVTWCLGFVHPWTVTYNTYNTKGQEGTHGICRKELQQISGMKIIVNETGRVNKRPLSILTLLHLVYA